MNTPVLLQMYAPQYYLFGEFHDGLCHHSLVFDLGQFPNCGDDTQPIHHLADQVLETTIYQEAVEMVGVLS